MSKYRQKRLDRAESFLREKLDPYLRMTLEKLDGTDPGMQKAIERGNELVRLEEPGEKPKRGMILFGAPGIGKTHLMVAMYREALKQEKTSIWWNALSLVRRIQKTYGDPVGGLERENIVKRILSHDLVFLDDLGKERRTEDVDTILYEIFDRLLEKSAQVVISTNLTSEEWVDKYNDATRSRIKEMCAHIKIEGKDRRNREATRRYRD